MSEEKKPQPVPERCPPSGSGSVLSRRITARDALPAVGERASLHELRAFLSDKVAKEIGRVAAAENVVADLIKPDAVAIHVSFSWG